MSYVQRTYDEVLDPVYVLSSIKGREYYFESISPFLSGAISRNKWKDGRQLKQLYGNFKYSDDYEEHCKFKLGNCSYDNYLRRHTDLFTEYSNGVWTRKIKTSTKSHFTGYITIREIFDASGLPLYKFKLVHGNRVKTVATEYVRMEYHYTSMTDPELMKAILKGAQIRKDRNGGAHRALLLERARELQQKLKSERSEK